MVKVVTIVGARPQFVKAAVVGRALKEHGVSEVLVHTGQHFDENMSDVFFREMEIRPPDHRLGIRGKTHGAMTGQMLQGIEEVLQKEQPQWVLVYGDTNSTLAGALAAVKLHTPVAHVEAGLRSFNRQMPEEINRILTDQCSERLFTPSSQATEQLLKEGVSNDRITEVGDVMYDAAVLYQTKMGKRLIEGNYALATVHRAENTDCPERLAEIFEGLIQVAEDLPVIIPLHPRTKQALQAQGLLDRVTGSLSVIEPVGYLEMINLESHADVILTDSGGVQKEAYYFQVPCLTLRTETEWTELVEKGYNELVPLNKEAIVAAFHHFSKKEIKWGDRLYGEGRASRRIAEVLISS